MNEAFNPYHAFLGLDPQVVAPNHYQLLGLRELEGDASKITVAAEKAMVRVRGQRPGQHAPEWSRLLDELQAAKTCLLDPAQKRGYDEQLAKKQPGPPKAKSPVAAPATPKPATLPGAAPQVSNGYPPGMGPQPAAPTAANDNAPFAPAPQYAPQPANYYAPPGYSPAPGMPNPAWNPAYQVSPAMQPMAPMPQGYPAPMPAGQGWPGTAPYGQPGMSQGPQAYDPMAPVAFTQAPAQPYGAPMGGYPMAGMPNGYPMAMPTAMPVQQAAPAVNSAEGFASPTVAKGRPIKRRRSNGPLLLVGTVIGSIAVVGGVLLALNRKGEQDNKQPTQVAQNTQPVTPVATTPKTPAVESKTPPRVEPEVPGTPMPPAENTRPKAPMVEEPPTAPAMKEPAEKMVKEAEPKEAMTLPTPPTPAPEKPATPSPEPTPAPETPEMKAPTPAELAELSKLVKEARATLGEFRFQDANELLTKAEMLAKMPEHQEKVARLQNVSKLAQQFQEAITRTMASLSAGEVLKVGTSTEAAIVDASPTELTIRLNGENRKYTLENMPLGLAVNLGERSLNPNSPATRAAKGAYVFVDKRSDAGQIKKAQTWWEEAQLNGMDMRHLMPVLTDKYDFTADTPKGKDDAE